MVSEAGDDAGRDLYDELRLKVPGEDDAQHPRGKAPREQPERARPRHAQAGVGTARAIGVSRTGWLTIAANSPSATAIHQTTA